MKIRSKSPTTRVITGDVTYVVEPGATVDVPADLGKQLCSQPDRWEQVTKKTADDGDKE